MSTPCVIKRRSETRTAAECPLGEYSDQCSSEYNSENKQFYEHQKSGIGAAKICRGIMTNLLTSIRTNGIGAVKKQKKKGLRQSDQDQMNTSEEKRWNVIWSVPFLPKTSWTKCLTVACLPRLGVAFVVWVMTGIISVFIATLARLLTHVHASLCVRLEEFHTFSMCGWA